MKRDELILAGKEFLFPAVIHFFDEPLVIERAKGQYVWDADGKQYLDFFGGIVTVSVGHANEQVTSAIREQSEKLTHVSTLYYTEPQIALAKRIAGLTPGGKLSKSFFTNSGTEANETAVSLARIHTGSSEIIALRHSYHGRSDSGRAMTGHGGWRGPLPAASGFVLAHNAYCYRCPFGLEHGKCGYRCATDLEELIATSTSGRIAGMIAEPIQGVGGFITPPKPYFEIVADIVRKHGGIFISDEVQTGWGRTGKWFGMEHYDVEPDVMTFAKGLGNGLPIGGTTAKPEIADSMRYLTLSTFGGNPVTTAAAKAVIDYVDEQKLLENCETVGSYLREKLEALQWKHSVIGDVRGMGLMQALELVTDRESKEPAVEITAGLLDEARKAGLLIGKGGLYGNVIRISPPMNIAADDVDDFVERIDRALTAATA